MGLKRLRQDWKKQRRLWRRKRREIIAEYFWQLACKVMGLNDQRMVRFAALLSDPSIGLHGAGRYIVQPQQFRRLDEATGFYEYYFEDVAQWDVILLNAIHIGRLNKMFRKKHHLALYTRHGVIPRRTMFMLYMMGRRGMKRRTAA